VQGDCRGNSEGTAGQLQGDSEKTVRRWQEKCKGTAGKLEGDKGSKILPGKKKCKEASRDAARDWGLQGGLQGLQGSAGSLPGDCRQAAGRLHGDSKPTAGQLQGDCKKTLGGLQVVCRDTAGGLPGDSRKTAGGLREDCRGTPATLQGDCRKTGGGQTPRGPAGQDCKHVPAVRFLSKLPGTLLPISQSGPNALPQGKTAPVTAAPKAGTVKCLGCGDAPP
jgi:hypothetical protein